MTTDSPANTAETVVSVRILTDAEKALLNHSVRPTDEGWYPDPLANPGSAIERFFSIKLGQWTGRTRKPVGASPSPATVTAAATPLSDGRRQTPSAPAARTRDRGLGKTAAAVGAILSIVAWLTSGVLALGGLIGLISGLSSGSIQIVLIGIGTTVVAAVTCAQLMLFALVARYIAARTI